jgi:hypothetical protein
MATDESAPDILLLAGILPQNEVKVKLAQDYVPHSFLLPTGHFYSAVAHWLGRAGRAVSTLGSFLSFA